MTSYPILQKSKLIEDEINQSLMLLLLRLLLQ
jgi:hypothetical protein